MLVYLGHATRTRKRNRRTVVRRPAVFKATCGSGDEQLLHFATQQLAHFVVRQGVEHGDALRATRRAQAIPDQRLQLVLAWCGMAGAGDDSDADGRSEEHTSELQSLMRISYAVFCLKKKK